MSSSIAKNILDLIDEHQLNQQSFAQKINVSQSQISDWISGKSKPSFDAIIDICTTFNISADYLLGLKEDTDKVSSFKPKYKISNRRYTGSRQKIKDWIKDLINKNCPNCKSFCDIFAGTGIVTDEMLLSSINVNNTSSSSINKDNDNHNNNISGNKYNEFILNDLLYSNEVIYKAFYMNTSFDIRKLYEYQMKYQSLEVEKIEDNYISVNFGNKYFEYGDSKLIGYIRQDIEDNKDKLNEREYSILIASLLYSLDKCANTVGHYEAYFKNKVIERRFKFNLISPYDTNKLGKTFKIFREDANTLASSLRSDIVYIDPPYSSRQYSRFYHVLENITKWDKPELFGSALKPKAENMSEYCSSSAKVAFKDLIDKLNCKYIVVSYNNTYNSKSKSSENKMRLEDILSILSSKGETLQFEMPFKAFNAGKTSIENHKELIFITKVEDKTSSSKKKNKSSKSESKDSDLESSTNNLIVRSPFFYVGDKYKLMGQLLKIFPNDIDNYYEPFCGGGSSFLNVKANKYYLNDIDFYMIKMHNMLNNYASNRDSFFNIIKDIEDKYHLSSSYRQDIIPKELKIEYPKTYFAKFNKEGFNNMKSDFNDDKTNYELLYVTLIYGFNRMLRFNSKGDFNLPVGNVDLNQNVINSLNTYFDFASTSNLEFTSLDFRSFFKLCKFKKGDFIYLDPPYLISNSEYNKLWTEHDEQDLLDILDDLNSKGVRFAISNLLRSKGKENTLFIEWASKYNVYDVKSSYINYHDNSIKKDSMEVLITNYEKRDV